MDFLEDLTPREYRFAWLPNGTIDDLTRRNLLSLGVLTNFVRHSETYGQTVSKLAKQAGGQGATQISRAYNDLIDAGYIGRVEYTYAMPEGMPGRPGRRTYGFVSRVRMTAQQLIDVVDQYTPGREIVVPLDTGHRHDDDTPVYAHRRVRILAAEIYCSRGALKINPDGSTMQHDKRRGARKPDGRRRNPQPEAAVVDSEIDVPQVTSENDGDDGSFGELDSLDPTSSGCIKNTTGEHEENGAGASLRSLPPTESSPPSNFRSDDEPVGSPSESVGVEAGSEGESPHARARDAGGTQASAHGTVNIPEDSKDAMTSSEARAAIDATLRRSGTTQNGPHSAAVGPQGEIGTHERESAQIDDQRATESAESGAW